MLALLLYNTVGYLESRLPQRRKWNAEAAALAWSLGKTPEIPSFPAKSGVQGQQAHAGGQGVPLQV
ncbi:hypothetical protein KSZ_24810 [Dictyobacter formicarum]|uniref:Uncharacterized protein n=1 Tax=Dictyobacter formicarum TaxID=2778368 RepID=A0ABQ3VES0_9CHLR|nr:hypothetical protein KSZ_24810 [Dictyobacter formicarum]